MDEVDPALREEFWHLARSDEQTRWRALSRLINFETKLMPQQRGDFAQARFRVLLTLDEVDAERVAETSEAIFANLAADAAFMYAAFLQVIAGEMGTADTERLTCLMPLSLGGPYTPAIDS